MVEGGIKLIALVGFPGMGKTSLAQALTAGSPFIEFADGKPNVLHVQAALESHGLGQYLVTEQNAPTMLAKLMCIKDGPRFVVLDNFQSTTQLRSIVPPNTAATIVATCRETGDCAPSWCHNILVEVMEPDESVQFAKLLAPSLRDEDAIFLTETLGHYALIIELACGHIRRTGIDVQALCRSLQITHDDIKTKAGEQGHVMIA